MKKMMKKITAHTPFFLLVMLLAFTSCAEKSTGSKVTNNYITNPLDNGNSDGENNSNNGSGSTTTCDGVPLTNDGTPCYFKNIPKLIFSGSGIRRSNSTPYWSSLNEVGSNGAGINPAQFDTDSRFSVRIKPVTISNGVSKQGRSCSTWTNLNYTRMRVVMKLRKSSQTVAQGSEVELTADVGGVSNTGRFTIPSGATSSPYILEIMSIETDHRCKASTYGAISSTQTAGCNDKTSWFDIPINCDPNHATRPCTTNPLPPTECVGLNIEMATDYTKDLPN
jgi:hypothetical protein